MRENCPLPERGLKSCGGNREMDCHFKIGVLTEDVRATDKKTSQGVHD